jgi:hypothetical protein
MMLRMILRMILRIPRRLLLKLLNLLLSSAEPPRPRSRPISHRFAGLPAEDLRLRKTPHLHRLSDREAVVEEVDKTQGQNLKEIKEGDRPHPSQSRSHLHPPGQRLPRQYPILLQPLGLMNLSHL